MELSDLERAIRTLGRSYPNPIVRIECSPAFYSDLKLRLKKISNKPVSGINCPYFGSLSGIPLIEVQSQIEPFRVVRVDDIEPFRVVQIDDILGEGV